MVSVEDTEMEGGGLPLKNAIWDAAQPVIEEWTQMEQRPSSMYGVRVYTEGAVLNPHADRLPLVSSCIVNVAQDVDEDWILEVFDRQGNAVNVTMEPGDMVLYESGSLIHGVSLSVVVSLRRLAAYSSQLFVLTCPCRLLFTASICLEGKVLCQYLHSL